jgi:hypothetical protein
MGRDRAGFEIGQAEDLRLPSRIDERTAGDIVDHLSGQFTPACVLAERSDHFFDKSSISSSFMPARAGLSAEVALIARVLLFSVVASILLKNCCVSATHGM